MGKQTPPAKSVVVTAVGVSAKVLNNPELAKRIEQAMTDEILKCTEEGIATTEENAPIIRQRMMQARQRVLEGR
jgi:hypothetical protein